MKYSNETFSVTINEAQLKTWRNCAKLESLSAVIQTKKLEFVSEYILDFSLKTLRYLTGSNKALACDNEMEWDKSIGRVQFEIDVFAFLVIRNMSLPDKGIEFDAAVSHCVTKFGYVAETPNRIVGTLERT